MAYARVGCADDRWMRAVAAGLLLVSAGLVCVRTGAKRALIRSLSGEQAAVFAGVQRERALAFAVSLGFATCALLAADRLAEARLAPFAARLAVVAACACAAYLAWPFKGPLMAAVLENGTQASLWAQYYAEARRRHALASALAVLGACLLCSPRRDGGRLPLDE